MFAIQIPYVCQYPLRTMAMYDALQRLGLFIKFKWRPPSKLPFWLFRNFFYVLSHKGLSVIIITNGSFSFEFDACSWLRNIPPFGLLFLNLVPSSKAGKSYTGEGSARFEKPVWRLKGRQLNKFRRMLLTIMKSNCCISQGLVSKAVFKLPDPSPCVIFPILKKPFHFWAHLSPGHYLFIK